MYVNLFEKLDRPSVIWSFIVYNPEMAFSRTWAPSSGNANSEEENPWIPVFGTEQEQIPVGTLQNYLLS